MTFFLTNSDNSLDKVSLLRFKALANEEID